MNGTERQIRRRIPHVWKQMQDGWEIAGRTGDGHVQLRHVASTRKVAVSLSPSCHRNDLNTRSRMRKIEAAHADLSAV